MAQFISIPVTGHGTTIISTDGLVAYWDTATSIKLAAGGKLVTLTMVSSTTASIDAIIKAALTLNGPTIVPVVLPSGQTCAAVTIA